MEHKDTSTNIDRLQKAREIKTMRKSFSTVRRRQKNNKFRLPDLEYRKQRLRQNREKSICNDVLLKLAVENLERNGIKVRMAKTKGEAIAMVYAEIEGEKLVVKSKSNVTKEIGLAKTLEDKGVNVVETDIGDRIIQVLGETPSHPTGPASHLSRYEIANRLSGYFNEQIEPTLESIVGIIRDDVVEFISMANIGITGANAIAAEEGAILLMHNEGNIIQVATRPGKHIVLAGIDKIYPNIEEAINMLKLQTFYATGSLSTSFINIISGTSQTADIEKMLYKGMHGPKEICMILVDNYRSEIANSEYKELLYCIGCGQCLLVCPAYNVYGNQFGINSQLGGKGVVYAMLAGESYTDHAVDRCLSCRRCQKNCPVGIDTPAMVNKLRFQRHEKLRQPHIALACDFMHAHIDWIKDAIKLEASLLLSRLQEHNKNE